MPRIKDMEALDAMERMKTWKSKILVGLRSRDGITVSLFFAIVCTVSLTAEFLLVLFAIVFDRSCITAV